MFLEYITMIINRVLLLLYISDAPSLPAGHLVGHNEGLVGGQRGHHVHHLWPRDTDLFSQVL